jgi:hypothetical protein
MQKTKSTLTDATYFALQRLARSSWGFQGCGKCSKKDVWIDLVHAGFARPVRSENKKILAITLSGFRALEAERWARELDKKPA